MHLARLFSLLSRNNFGTERASLAGSLFMDNFELIPPLARARPPLSQMLWGISISAIFISLQTVLWSLLAPSPYVLLPMAIVLASFFGGGLISGLTTTLILVVYSFRFPEAQRWLPQLVFFGTGTIGTFLVSSIQKKIRELAGAEVRVEQAERLKFAAASADLGIWEWDLKNGTLTWDDKMLKFFGMDRASFNGSPDIWKKWAHPDDISPVNQILKDALEGKRELETEMRVIQRGGDVRILKSNGLVLRDTKGKPTKMFGLTRDITVERRNLEETRELKAYFEAALVQSQAGIVIADAPSGRLRLANPEALRIAGGDESSLVTDVDINRYGRWRITSIDGVPIENEDLPLARAVRFGEASSQKLVFVRPNGEKRVVLGQTAPIRRDDGSIMSGITVFVDITEQQKLMEELKLAREAAEVAMRAKAKFLDIAAHELRTPVTAASLLAELIQRKMANGISPDMGSIQRIRVQLERLSRLVIDLLEVSKLDRGVLELRCELIDLASLVSDCRNTFKIQYPNRDIRFEAPKEPLNMMVDPIRIYEVISNLLDNAIKYSPEDSPVELKIEIKPEKIRFSVEDHGPGLTQECQRKLFLAFERGSESPNSSGLGLGLFISRGIINLHEGQIGVQSQPGIGSSFYFELPRNQFLRKTGTGT